MTKVYGLKKSKFQIHILEKEFYNCIAIHKLNEKDFYNFVENTENDILFKAYINGKLYCQKLK